jgi:hypothetical protein
VAAFVEWVGVLEYARISAGAGFYVSLYGNSIIMGVWRQVAEYFYIKKRDPNAPNTQWMRYMHGINRISIFMFLLGIIFMILRLFFFKRH